MNAITSMLSRRVADAEQAKKTGGMIALIPRTADAEMLAMPGGEPVEDLHVTLAFFGKDIADASPDQATRFCQEIADQGAGPVQARVFGHALLNPDKDPCLVYLVGEDNGEGADGVLQDLQRTAAQCAIEKYGAPQHQPWLAHLTAGYAESMPLDYTGPLVLDRIRLAWGGDIQDFPL
ncbi:RNA ligase [Gordonia phage Pupper]|uniref:RNA ligase n=1 Tax=Gordonia phage Pupper TaxID=2571249 RepID=A0A4Y6EIL8_9CAUD|nr:RNA ligase [Gordonia phage Pupper]QDF18578.1 RNA ligase [Gordonia phage Pupper]QDF18810.1 RNA ligase [Gordonia phage SCentae]